MKKSMFLLACVLSNLFVLAQNKYISVNFSTGSSVIDGISGLNTSGTLEDRYDNSYHLKLLRGEYLTFSFDVSMNSPSGSFEIQHLTSASGDKNGYSPVTLYVNNHRVESWDNLGKAYITDKIAISAYLKKGNNKIDINYNNNGGSTGYWIKFVHIYTW
ncbi:MAG: hypothetical protein ACOYMF_02585 [Bacteroidales bacterium]